MAIHIHLHPRQVDKTKDGVNFLNFLKIGTKVSINGKQEIIQEVDSGSIMLKSGKKITSSQVTFLGGSKNNVSITTKDASFQKGDKVRENRAGAPTWEVLKQIDNILYTTGGNLHVSKAVKVNDVVTPSQIQAYLNARKEVDQIAAVIEKKEDQGVSISVLLRNQLEQARKKENSFPTEVKQAARDK